MARAAVVVVGIALAVALFLVLRPGGDDEAATSNPLTAVETAETVPTTTAAPTTTAPATTTTAAPDRLVIRIDARRDSIARPKVKRNRRVVLRVTADVADHVHVHGYDLMRDVAPGQPAEIAFTASIPGVFEIELEDAGKHIAELEVSP